MRAAVEIPALIINDSTRGRIMTKYTPGATVEASIKTEVLILPDAGIKPLNATLTLKERRSIPQLGLYRWVCRWLENNTPEEILHRIGGPISEDAWHQVIMGRFGITSTKFERLDQDGFQEYFTFCGKWLFECFSVHIDDVIIYMRGEEG